MSVGSWPYQERLCLLQDFQETFRFRVLVSSMKIDELAYGNNKGDRNSDQNPQSNPRGGALPRKPWFSNKVQIVAPMPRWLESGFNRLNWTCAVSAPQVSKGNVAQKRDGRLDCNGHKVLKKKNSTILSIKWSCKLVVSTAS